MQTLTTSREELCRKFWEEIHPAWRESADIEHSEMLKASCPELSREGHEKIVAEVMKRMKALRDEVDELVKAELWDASYTFFSSPTKFSITYARSVAKHYDVVKRKRLGPQATDPIDRRDCGCGYGEYDVERDIALTAKQFAELEQTSFVLEKDFLKAADEKRFKDADALLTAIEISRKDAELVMRAEANNWRFELAAAKGDPEMFIGAWQKIIDVAIVDREMLFSLLQKLLYNGLIKGVAVGLSSDGKRHSRRAPSMQEFCDQQAAIYMKSVISEIGDGLIAGKCTSAKAFRTLIESAFERSRKSSLAVNPYLAIITVVWK